MLFLDCFFIRELVHFLKYRLLSTKIIKNLQIGYKKYVRTYRKWELAFYKPQAC
jgi:hypothetical protein